MYIRYFNNTHDMPASYGIYSQMTCIPRKPVGEAGKGGKNVDRPAYGDWLRNLPLHPSATKRSCQMIASSVLCNQRE